MTSWRNSVADILRDDICLSTRPSIQCVDRIQRMTPCKKREEAEVTEHDAGQHSKTVRQRSSHRHSQMMARPAIDLTREDD